MSILSGFKKQKIRQKLADGNYQNVSHWTSSQTVEMNNGNTVEGEISDIIDGTTPVGKAESDSDGNVIPDTYLRQDKVANNLVTSDTSYALGAPQGVALDGRLTTVENALTGVYLPKIIVLENLTTPVTFTFENITSYDNPVLKVGRFYIMRAYCNGYCNTVFFQTGSSATDTSSGDYIISKAITVIDFSMNVAPYQKLSINSKINGTEQTITKIELIEL